MNEVQSGVGTQGAYCQEFVWSEQWDMSNRIREIRVAKGWTQAELADHIDTSPSVVSGLESGKTRLNSGWIEKICAAFDIAPWALFLDPVHVNHENREKHVPMDKTAVKFMKRLNQLNEQEKVLFDDYIDNFFKMRREITTTVKKKT